MMKLEKEDFGIWDNDDEELSIIKEGYKSKEIADYILWLQEELEHITDTNKIRKPKG